jgi:hypothetical protein
MIIEYQINANHYDAALQAPVSESKTPVPDLGIHICNTILLTQVLWGRGLQINFAGMECINEAHQHDVCCFYKPLAYEAEQQE